MIEVTFSVERVLVVRKKGFGDTIYADLALPNPYPESQSPCRAQFRAPDGGGASWALRHLGIEPIIVDEASFWVRELGTMGRDQLEDKLQRLAELNDALRRQLQDLEKLFAKGKNVNDG